jgi:protein-S-isoprenylcysteine O-methyltransferase Ste14
MTLPKNVLRFEVLLYASLMLDAVSVAVHDRTPRGEATEAVPIADAIINGLIILGMLYLVRLAAERRKNWPRWVFTAALVYTVLALLSIIGEGRMALDDFIEIVSCGLTGMGLYYSYTGDARGWFNA